MSSSCFNERGDSPSPNNDYNLETTFQTSGNGIWSLSGDHSKLVYRRGNSLPDMKSQPKVYLHGPHSNNIQGVEYRATLSPNSSDIRSVNLDLHKSLSSTETIRASGLTPPSSSIIDDHCTRKFCQNDRMAPTCGSDCAADCNNSLDGFVSSLEESFHYSSCGELAPDSTDGTICPSRFSSSLNVGVDTINSGADDSGYGFQADELPKNLSGYKLSVSPECTKLCCQETASANQLLRRDWHEFKTKSDAKDAAIVGLKSAITNQYLEKEDILQQKLKLETDLKACQQRLETTRKSEMRFRDNYYQSAARLNSRERELISLQGEVTSRTIFANKLQMEMMQTHSQPNKNYSPRVCEDTIVHESGFKTEMSQGQLVPPLEQTVMLLEQQKEKLQDDSEDLLFKAQRHEEEAALLRSQNAELLKKCSDLQRRLVECLSAVNVLDVRCTDGESKLQRARQALEEKEKLLLTISSEHTAALLKIEKNDRELESVRTEMANVTRNFMKISCNQRDLKEDLQFYKNIIMARDQKIQKLMEERDQYIRYLKESKSPKEGNASVCSCKEKGTVVKRDVRLQVDFPDVVTSVSGLEEQCQTLKNDIAIGDNIMSEQMMILKSQNEKLTTQVESLNNELENRCAVSVLKITHIMKTIDRLENDMNQFLASEGKDCNLVTKVGISNQMEVESCSTDSPLVAESRTNDEFAEPELAAVLKANSELLKKLTRAKEEAGALRRANADLEEKMTKQADWIAQGQEAGARQVAFGRLSDFKISHQAIVSIEPIDQHLQLQELNTSHYLKPVQRANTAVQENIEFKINRLSAETKAVLLENANNELVAYVDSLHKALAQMTTQTSNQLSDKSMHGFKTPQEFFDVIDLLRGSQTSINVFDELYRISVFLQVSLLKTRTILPKEKTNHCFVAIMSSLESLLLKVRLAMSSGESISGETNREENNVLVAQRTVRDVGTLEAEPNILVASKTELETQLAVYQKNNSMLREALAISEDERRKEKQRHKIQLYDLIQRFKLRLKENNGSSTSGVVKDENRSTPNSFSKSEHRVCTDMVVNLKRNLRASESGIVELQKQMQAKTDETWKLQQEISEMRSDLEAVHDILDNKKIALGRSEAVGQMLRVSEANLEHRLDREQREHEDCRQQLEKLAACLEDTRIRKEEIEDLRCQLVEKEEKLSAARKDYNQAVREKEILLQQCKDRETEQRTRDIRGEDHFTRVPLLHKELPGGDIKKGERTAKLVIPSPIPAMNKSEIRSLVERAKLPRSDIIRLLDERILRISEDLKLLQQHLEERKREGTVPAFVSGLAFPF